MPIHTLKLIDRYEVARNTKVFVFEKPTGFIFKSGQYGGFTLINPTDTDAQGNTRRFSILSAPHDNFLAIVTRIQSSAFKRTLDAFENGNEIKFAGPTGDFILHDDINTPVVMLAGGIGIAPFYSMIHERTANQSKQPLYLFYGNTQFSDAAFIPELQKLAECNPHFHFIPTFDHTDESWQGEHGYITHTMIKKYISDISSPIFYICGSPVMVTTLQELLVEMDIEEDKIRVEDFPGY